VCKSHKTLSNPQLTFWFMNTMYILEHVFAKKKFPEETWPKIYLGQDPEPDPDVFKSRIRTFP
jgi:hypothetical protein